MLSIWLTCLQAAAPAQETYPTNWLVIAPVDQRGRRPFRPDAVFARHLLDRSAAAPQAGQTLRGETGEEQSWTALESSDGSLAGSIGWAYARVVSERARVVLAKLSGASTLFVDGAAFPGDLYGYGFGGVPVALEQGPHDVFVTGVRGSCRLSFVEVDGPLVVGTWDWTRPDRVAGRGRDLTSDKLGALVLNTSAKASGELQLVVRGQEGETRQSWRSLPPLFLAKRAVELPRSSAAAGTRASFELAIEGPALGDRTLAASFDLETRARSEARRETFVSTIDGSVQERARLEATGERRAIVLTLHGAGVDSLNQARSYSPKPDLEILAPTNRRPFGFDWQDWGRFDAYEALGERPGEGGGKRWPVYLTGHSMGGHGAWSLAVLDPDRFRAVAPSAGWCSFDTYGGRPEGELAAIWRAADAVSLVDQGVENLCSVPIYVLHGAADDNVPVAQATDMARRLEEAEARFELQVREGAGHWWDGDGAPGVDCVDWPGIFELFGRTVEAPTWETFVWRSVDPGVDGSHAWLSYLAPRRWGAAARFEARWVETEKQVELATDNVARFALQGEVGEACRELIVDGQRLSFVAGEADQVELLRRNNSWTVYRPGRDTPVGQQKSPRSAGPFKRAFDQLFLVVIGTAGDGAEDRELLERARFDVCTWWYRANATPEVFTDVEFLALEKKQHAKRNVILYGNQDTNSAWARLIGSSPVDARRGALVVGEREFQGDDLGAVFVRPRRDVSTGALVGAFADSGIVGARLGYGLAPFVSGVGYPDYAVFSKEILTRGDGGVLAAGWFDEAWRLQSGGFLRAPAAADEAGR